MYEELDFVLVLNYILDAGFKYEIEIWMAGLVFQLRFSEVLHNCEFSAHIGLYCKRKQSIKTVSHNARHLLSHLFLVKIWTLISNMKSKFG